MKAKLLASASGRLYIMCTRLPSYRKWQCWLRNRRRL